MNAQLAQDQILNVKGPENILCLKTCKFPMLQLPLLGPLTKNDPIPSQFEDT